MKEIALEVSHVSIDYRNLTHMSLAKSFAKGVVKKAETIRAVNDVSFTVKNRVQKNICIQINDFH